MSEKSKERCDFLIAICLIAHFQMGKGIYIANSMKQHIKKFEEAGLIDHVPISSSIRRERIKRFIQEYGGEGEE
ncbi:MAG: hypothetical protein ACTSRR_09735 [Candidatus Heimdallarchaeaceae archaeon]